VNPVNDRRTAADEMMDDRIAEPECWVDRHGDVLYRYALLRLRSADRAADVVQETFVEALRARASFAGKSSERTWLIGILRHKLRMSARDPAGSNGVPIDAALEPVFDHRGRWRTGPSAWNSDPSLAVETREFWDVFGGCLSKLPKGIAEAFFLRELDGMTAEQIQDVLGITPANFWKRLHRARMLLRQCLETGWFDRRTEPSSPSPKGSLEL
jgi:RNA polymerase sigma-70 factor (TIGR02943 family)